MIFKRISTIRLVITRFTDLDLWRLTLLFIKVVRQQGVFSAIKKAWRLLFWDQGLNYLNEAQQWYEQNNCTALSETAEQLLSRPNILIIGSLDLPQCKKYRVLQKVELLESMGYRCEISEYRDIPRVFNKMQLATLVLFYRVPDGELFSLYLSETERLKIATGYDIDDPIFAPDVYAENKNLDMLSHTEKQSLLDSASEYREAMAQCGFISISTPGMQELVKTIFSKPSYLWRNVLDGETLSIVAQQQKRQPPNRVQSELVVITYMSGSRAHDADFSSIEQVLTKIMADYPHVQLLIGGYAAIPDVLQPFSTRIKQFPFSGYAGYFGHLAQSDICVIPLLQDRFNDCKSAIRYLEAAVLGIPTIATNIGDFKNLIINGENGFLASSDEEWDIALRQLIEDQVLHKNISQKSREYVMENQTLMSLSSHMNDDISVMLGSVN